MRFFIRFFTIVSLVLLSCSLMACTAEKTPVKKDFSVAVYNITPSVVNLEDVLTNRLSFVVKNQEPFALDCSVLLVIDNDGAPSKKKGSLGILEPGESKPGTFTYVMPDGDTDIDILPVCSKP